MIPITNSGRGSFFDVKADYWKTYYLHYISRS